MLSDRARIILFWFTIALMVIVAVLAAMTILRACGGPAAEEQLPKISPGEISLCQGERHQFAVAEGGDVAWEATGGTISQDGRYTAGEDIGEYTVTAKRDGSRRAGTVIVHIIVCTPTPTPRPTPTPLPTPTPTEPPTPTPEEGAGPTSGDAQGDVGAYETGAPVEGAPAGVDISSAGVGGALKTALRPTGGISAELSDFPGEGEVLLWISLHEAIPDPPAAYTNWLLVLDVDGSTDTGRPPGSRRINPDLGDEVAVGVSYNPETEAYEPYALVWDSEQADWTSGPDTRYTVVESRKIVGLALSMEALGQAVSEASGTTIAPDAANARAAAETYTAEGNRVIDFYPELPE